MSRRVSRVAPLLALILVAGGSGAAGALSASARAPARDGGAAAARPDAPAPGPGRTQPAAPAAPTGISLETPGTNQRISVDANGGQLDARSTSPAISDDGKRLVFLATTVVNGQATVAVLLRDRAAGTTTTVYSPATNPVGEVSVVLYPDHPAISGDGNWVAFDVGDGKSNRVILWSAATGLINPFSTRSFRFAFSVRPSLSGDGRFIAFIGQGTATAVALTPRDFVFDRQEGVLTTVGLDEAGQPLAASQYQGEIAISSDGSTVAYAEQAPGDQTGSRQVWRAVVGDKAGTLVSVATGGGPGNGDSGQPALDADGSVIVFTSRASNLVAGDSNEQPDVFRWTADGLRRVSVAPDGTEANGGSIDPDLTANGRQVAFASWATNLVPGDSTGGISTRETLLTDIFVLDVPTTRLSRVSVGKGPAEPDGPSTAPALSASGRQVAFTSLATNLVSDDTNDSQDVFLRDRLAAVQVTVDPTDFGAAPVGAPPGVTRTVTVESTGGFAAKITGASITGSGASSFLVSNNACPTTSLYPGETCTIQLTFVPASDGALAATLQVAAVSPAKPNPVHLTGTGSAGTIRLEPDSGPPGTVTVVTGSGFGGNLPVTFRWSVGITPALLDPVVTAPDGSFTTQVLVLPRDRTGPRNLVATPTLPAGPGPAVSARFRVSIPTGVPPLFGLVQTFRDLFGRVIVLRR
jgi:Tol biopolymer transport system component